MTGGLRVGIDVGGTNTDAAVVGPEGAVVASYKTPTTPDPFVGIDLALEAVLAEVDGDRVTHVMLGTTHPLNAVIRRRGLATVGILRLGAPATLAVAPLAGWPRDLAAAVAGHVEIVGGGHEYAGREIATLDEKAVLRFAEICRGQVDAIAITGVSSPAVRDHELRAATLVGGVLGGAVPLTLGHEVGGLGLLERENSAVLNAALTFVGIAVVRGLERALERRGLDAQIFVTQNDGTLLSAAEAVRRPILTVGAGPTNSMRGAAHVSGLSDAIVMDVGGTSTDVGLLLGGFPRESAHAVEIGGVRTNYRMPDLIAVGLGGGTIVHAEPDLVIGPDSVGYRLTERALIFGGGTATLSDVAAAAGRMSFGVPAPAAAELPPNVVAGALAWVDDQVERLADRIRGGRAGLPVIAVGGGAGLLPDRVPGVSEIVRPDHASVANAVGAATAEASGSVDRVFAYDASSREDCLATARAEAVEAAHAAGARLDDIRIIAVNEIPMAYLPGELARVQVKAVGPLTSMR